MRLRKRWVIPAAMVLALLAVGVGYRVHTYSAAYRVPRLLSAVSARPKEPGMMTQWLIKLRLVKPLSGPRAQAVVDELVALGKPAVPLLIAALDDERLEARVVAIEALGRIGDRRAVEPLIEALDKKHYGSVRNDSSVFHKGLESISSGFDLPATLREAGEYGWPMAFIRDKSAEVRAAVARALGRIGDARAVGPLLAMMMSGRVRTPVMYWTRPGTEDRTWVEIVPPGGRGGTTPDIFVSVEDTSAFGYVAAPLEAAAALAQLGRGGLEKLLATLKQERRETRTVAAWALGEYGDVHAAGGLAQALADEDPAVREMAAAALVALGDAAVEPLREFIATTGPAQEKAKEILKAIEKRK